MIEDFKKCVVKEGMVYTAISDRRTVASDPSQAIFRSGIPC